MVSLVILTRAVRAFVFQYFKIKFGFDAVMWDWQLEKIEKIFKRENFEIHSTKINLTQKMNQSWQEVGGVDKSMGLWPHMKSSSGILNVTDSIDCLTLVDISGLNI